VHTSGERNITMPKFRTTIDADGENGAWATITIPLDVPS